MVTCLILFEINKLIPIRRLKHTTRLILSDVYVFDCCCCCNVTNVFFTKKYQRIKYDFNLIDRISISFDRFDRTEWAYFHIMVTLYYIYFFLQNLSLFRCMII